MEAVIIKVNSLSEPANAARGSTIPMFLFRRWQSRNLYPKSLSENSIRILTILPGTWVETITCDLRETQIQDAGSYMALSYAWRNGDDDDHEVQITCNKTSIKVTSNLHSALRRLRHDRDGVKIWADAICINQNDNTERTCQVGFMRDIYAQSSEVVIWLGESSPEDHLGDMVRPMLTADESASLYQWRGDSTDLPKLRAFVSKSVEKLRDTAHSQDITDIFGAFYVLHALISGLEPTGIQELRHFAKSGPILRGFNALIKSRWWSRAWVVQEVVVAQSATIRYGAISAPWKFFSLAASQYEKARLEANADSAYPYLREQSLARFSRMVLEIETTRNDWNLGKPVGLLPLLRKFRSRSSSDERDKIFALLGLVRFWRTNEQKILPDYHLDAITVSLKTTKSLLASFGSLFVLAGTLRSNECCDSNPSWVIDWNYQPTVNEEIRLGNLRWYDSGGRNGLVELHQQRIMKVQGSCLDEVLWVGDELVDTTIMRMRHVIQGWTTIWVEFLASQPFNKRGSYIGGGSVADAFWRTICGDLEYVKTREYTMSTVKNEFRKATAEGSLAFEQLRSADHKHRRETSIIGGFWLENNDPDPEIERRNAFHYAVECASAGRRFFLTKTGYIGVGPRNMARRDLAFVLKGSQVPFILRTTNRSVACMDDRIETLNSATASQLTYLPAGKDAKAPEYQKVCNDVHTDCYYVIGDAYVHGVMNQQAMPDSHGCKKAQSIFLD
ncbi:hypothetical protein L207DRAFT_633096 [Hyaloscypha variabilis F]|uniref:Heterokaryon incompatibility domain-containing protein n=1 Tax=Hyaloscypha variabilis (strain UAMH 11265 / GT02V1 / F) TaxID=1149755 RepID=A0A2J6RTD9_HYAVF|nr:hypothetical protein L207DRAFT_633096 [Hyaloscypha variabilis F]